MKAGTPEQFAAHLEKQFPGEKQAIDKFIELVEVRMKHFDMLLQLGLVLGHNFSRPWDKKISLSG